jgi:hypothetical protein
MGLFVLLFFALLAIVAAAGWKTVDSRDFSDSHPTHRSSG